MIIAFTKTRFHDKGLIIHLSSTIEKIDFRVHFQLSRAPEKHLNGKIKKTLHNIKGLRKSNTMKYATPSIYI